LGAAKALAAMKEEVEAARAAILAETLLGGGGFLKREKEFCVAF